MPFSKVGAVPLDAVVNFRVTTAEKLQLHRDAELSGLSVSRYLRRRALGRRIMARADAAMLRELRRIGGLLKHIHVDSGGIYSKETSAALASVRAYIDELSRDDRQEDL